MVILDPIRFALYLHELSQQNDRILAALDEQLGESAQLDEMRRGCSPPEAGWLVLLDNEWDTCEVDRVPMRVDLLPGAPEPPPRHGFSNVCAGRHVVRTKLPAGTATLDTLVFPGDMVAVRLDEDRAVWTPIDAEETVALVDMLNDRTVELYSYFQRVASPRLAAGQARPREEILPAIDTTIRQIAAQLDAGASPATFGAVISQLAGALVGLPLPSFDLVVAPLAAGAYRRATEGERDVARLVAHVGLALLPGEPSLLATLAAIDAMEGKWAEATALAQQAQAHADEKTGKWLAGILANRPR